MKSNINGELRNWYRVGKMFAGNIYGDRRFKEGKFVYTGYIKEVIDKKNEDWIIVVTFNNTRFVCWRDKHHEIKKDLVLV